MVSIPKLHSKVKDGDIDGDWVTIGVIVDKLPPRQVYTYMHTNKVVISLSEVLRSKIWQLKETVDLYNEVQRYL